MIQQPSVIGRYEVIDLLPGGEGGMGLVYRALDPNLARTVAIKVLHDSLLSRPDILRRFYAEARAAANLRHPNIITIYDFGEYEDRPFIVMEFIEGQTLKTIIEAERNRRVSSVDPERTPFTLARKVALAEQLCAGLACAHAAGIVHRDIKPANLLNDRHDRLTIVDFGIAMIRDVSGLTMTQGPIGTLGYMAPEQFESSGCDHRADVFASGAVIYELLTGQQAFPGATYTEVMKRVLHDEPAPLERLCPGLDPRLGRIVEKALRKDARDRYQGIELLRRDLARVMRGDRTPPPEVYDSLAEVKAALTAGNLEDAVRLLQPLLEEQPLPLSVIRVRDHAVEALLERANECREQGDSSGVEHNARLALLLDAARAEAQDLIGEPPTDDSTDEISPPPPPPPRPWYRRPVIILATLALLLAGSLAAWKAAVHLQSTQEVERRMAQAARYAAVRDWTNAIGEYDAILRLVPGHPGALEARRQTTASQQRQATGAQVAELLKGAREDCAAGNDAASKDKARRLVEMDSSNAEARDLLARDCAPPSVDLAQLRRTAQGHADNGRYRSALADLDRILNAAPGDEQALALRQAVVNARSAEVARILRSAAQRFENEGEYDGPLEQVREALRLDPGNKDAVGLRDRILSAKNAEERRRRN